MKLPVLTTAYSQINNLLYKSYLPKIINVAIAANLFEALSAKSLSLNEISEKLKTCKPVTEALLDVLLAIGFMIKQDEKYGLTPLSEEYLVQNSGANQLHDVSRYSGSAGPFDNLQASLQGEKILFDSGMWSSKEAVLGMEQGAKAGSIQRVISFVKEIPEFSLCTKMCDFAGSIGYYSFALLNENKKLHSHVYDLPIVCELAKEVKKSEAHFNRVCFHAFNMAGGDAFGDGYNLFFSSHFLYESGANGNLTSFLKKVNRSMAPGGIFISNHISGNVHGDNYLTLTMVELMTRAMGYPTHQLPEETLKSALLEAGFGEFSTRQPDENIAFPALLLAAKKMKEI